MNVFKPIMINKKWIGYELGVSELPIEESRLRFFAKSIGEDDPIYTCKDAAYNAGYPNLPAPPTFIFSAELDSGAIDKLLELLEVPVAKLLHGEQSFTYKKAVCAGDRVFVSSKIEDIYDKKNGALEFIVKSSSAKNQLGEVVAEMRTVLVCRH